MEKLGLADKIAQEVVRQFDLLHVKSGKPTIRSNGTKEWTVLAGLVALEGDCISVLTLATGVKTMPDEVRKYSSGWIVHDMHAEILCLRLFNWLLVEEAMTFSTEGLSLLEENKEKETCRFKLRESIKLALYVSEPPCGDASMSGLSANQEAWEEPPTKKLQVMRGRAHFNKVGVVRTKPGRADSVVSLSKSCSDKLCLKQFIGILNCISSKLVLPVYLDYLVLQKDKYNEADFRRCFTERLSNAPPENQRLKVLIFDQDDYKFHKADEATPLLLSLIYCVPKKTVQVLNNGVKNGAYVKKKPPKPSGASFLCKRKLYEQAKPLIGIFDKYLHLKVSDIKRQAMKEYGRAQLDNWPPSGEDDFYIESD